MKKLVFIAIFIGAFTLQAQEYLGTWSFESVDREAIQDGVLSEEELDKRLKMVSNMFGSLKINIAEDLTYSLTMMGQTQSFPYTVNENILLLNNGDKLEILTKDKARFSSGKMVLFLQKGDVTLVKTYNHLKETSYENQKVDAKLLIGKWKVEEVRAPENVEGGEMMEMIGMMIKLNFITDSDMSLGAMGMETVKKYKVDSETNELKETDSDTGEVKTTYVINELDENHMILTHLKEGMLLYLLKE